METIYGIPVVEYIAAKAIVDAVLTRQWLAEQGVPFESDPLQRISEADAAKMLKCSTKSVKRRAEDGHFSRHKDGARVYYLKHEIEGYKNGFTN